MTAASHEPPEQTRHSRWRSLGDAVLGPLASKALQTPWLRHVPLRGGGFRQPTMWARPDTDTPTSMRTVPGIWRDREAEQASYGERPVYEFFVLHPEAHPVLHHFGWDWVIPTAVRRLRMNARVKETSAKRPARPAVEHDPDGLTREVRVEADRLGISAVGFSRPDPKYVFAGHDLGFARSVIVCVLEQDWDLTQQIPSAKCERGVMRTYAELVERAAALAEMLQARGFRAEPQGPAGAMLSIHYAVEAGLGQLGLNGQLLTPAAGSRCRLVAIATDAEFTYGEPVDYGIHALCDECQLCVRRCPPGAIPKNRGQHRGITKAKIKSERCLPTMMRAHGCAICMKVCPVQRYGLERVREHYVETGEILGKGTDELEGFDWVDGRRYGPGEKPRISQDFIRPGGFQLDVARTTPPSGAAVADEEDLF